MTESAKTATIVVGIDGSDPSKEALRWAIDQAAKTGATVDAIMAWEYPTEYGWAPNIDAGELVKSSEQALSETVAEVAGDNPPAAIRTRVVEGHPAYVLIRASADAQLLVVGCRGHGGFVGALLGSVSQHCVHHAQCPVVVIHSHR